MTNFGTDSEVRHKQYGGECALLNKESTRSFLNLFKMRNIPCADLEVQRNNTKESVLY